MNYLERHDLANLIFDFVSTTKASDPFPELLALANYIKDSDTNTNPYTYRPVDFDTKKYVSAHRAFKAHKHNGIHSTDDNCKPEHSNPANSCKEEWLVPFENIMELLPKDRHLKDVGIPRLWEEFCDETMKDYTPQNFVNWLEEEGIVKGGNNG